MAPLLAWGLESALLATLVAACAWAVELTGRRPRLAHALWALVLLRLLVPPLVCLELPAWGWPAAPAQVISTPVMDPTTLSVELGEVERLDTLAAASVATSAIHPWSIALWLWLAGTLAWSIVGLGRVGRLIRGLRGARLAGSDLQLKTASLARELGLRRPPRLLIASGRFPPLTFGVPGRAWVLLPVELVQQLGEHERSTVLAHELAHLARGDHLLRWVEVAATAMFWWLPTLWIARRHLHELEESCTDARVIATLPQCAEDYARALVDTALFLSRAPRSRPHLACEISALASLKRRLKMIEESNETVRPANTARVLLAAMTALTLLAWPTVAQEPEGGGYVEVQPISETEALALTASLEQRVATLEQNATELSARELASELTRFSADWLRVRGSRVETVGERTIEAGRRLEALVESLEEEDALLGKWMRLALSEVLDDLAAADLADLPPDTPLFMVATEIYWLESGVSEKAIQRAIGRPFDQVADGYITLTPAQRQALRDAKGLETLAAPRLTVYEAQRANISVVNQIAYVARFEVEEVEGGGKIIDPIVDVAQDGLLLDLIVNGDEPRRRLLVDLELTISNIKKPIMEVETKYGTVQRPQVETSKISALLPMKDGEPTLVGGLQQDGRMVYLVLETTRVELKDITPEPK